MRTSLTITLAKLAAWLNRMTGSGGSAFPGLVAEKLQSNILKDLAKHNFSRGIVIITGTNGKTTTSKMVAQVLESADISFIHNRTGSNLSRGIISTLIAESDLRGRIKADLALLEVDEASLSGVMKSLKPTVLVVTNLFRDQLDRYGEVDSTAKLLRKTLQGFTGQLCLNADDPMVVSLASDHKPIYFGISNYDRKTLEHDTAIDVVKSPTSNQQLEYKKRYFGHLGIYQTANGDFVRPNPNIEVVKVGKEDQTGSLSTIKIAGDELKLKLKLPGLYNIYNALATLSVASCLKLNPVSVVTSLADVTAAFGRVEEVNFEGRRMLLLLIKNPTGFNQIISTFLAQSNTEPILIIINDNFADGRDVSWLWDVAIEDMTGCEGPIFVSGLRAYDMALRLEYAGLTDITVEPDVGKAIKKLADKTKPGQRALILPTYTAMLEARKILIRNSNGEEFWR